MFNKLYIKKAAAIAAVILAATALPVNMANADTQTTESTVTGSTVTGSTANQAASEYTEIRTAACRWSKDTRRWSRTACIRYTDTSCRNTETGFQ